ncbi:MAG: hypothetical protein RL632_2278 [Bacteroidota bacterium]|jgi:hypothetical protein
MQRVTTIVRKLKKLHHFLNDEEEMVKLTAAGTMEKTIDRIANFKRFSVSQCTQFKIELEDSTTN